MQAFRLIQSTPQVLYLQPNPPNGRVITWETLIKVVKALPCNICYKMWIRSTLHIQNVKTIYSTHGAFAAQCDDDTGETLLMVVAVFWYMNTLNGSTFLTHCNM
jgi:hypothetical protein